MSTLLLVLALLGLLVAGIAKFLLALEAHTERRAGGHKRIQRVGAWNEGPSPRRRLRS